MMSFLKSVRRKTAEDRNLLDMKPMLKDHIRFVSEEDQSRVEIERKNWLERLSVKWMKQPPTRNIHLDPLGAAVIRQCEGTRTVQQIADRVYEEFGEEAEPLLPRLVKFIEIMELNDWLSWKKDEPS
ncbi:PqqD family protein [Paenibacillus larvae]|nr:PqqD family protein [Paenibacillus larvae]MCY9774173.1 PqqD family protein [Paenibacillus larvae]